ncbi:hypothetical protein [Actinomadura sp. 9N407]|uniref:hypothetical protein n=1 Tax=Actinomadura sp. 9N407 TaxID=3375154 RepID=UPI003795BBB3
MTAGVLVSAGCGSSDDASSDVSPPPTSAKASASPPAPSVSPSDGTKLAACADGKCEVRVGPGARIPVPRRMKVHSVRVQSVSAADVTIVGRYTGDSVSNMGSGNYSFETDKGKFKLTMGLNSWAAQNDFAVAVVAIHGGFAVLRMPPA